MTLAADIVSLLSGVGTYASNLFVARLPPSPLIAMLITETGGTDTKLYLNRGIGLEYPHFQIAVRHTDHDTGRAWIQQAYVALHGYAGMVNGTSYKQVRAMQPPAFLETGDRDTYYFVQNYQVIKER